MGTPVVSVVVPTYRRPDILPRAVESVRDQTFEDWELLVVNDAPDCDVGDVLPEDDRITYLQHDRNRGAPIARNTGIDAATGEYVALLDDDDAWKPDKLRRQLDLFADRTSEYGMVYSGREVVRDGEVLEEYRAETTGWIFEDLLAGNCIPSETPLIRRRCFDEVGGFDPAFESSQDLDMWLRIAREYKVDAVADPLAVAYRGHGERISEDMDRKYEGTRRIVEKYDSDFRERPDLLAQRYKTLGTYALNAGRPRDARRAFLRSIRTKPGDPLTVAYVGLALLPGPVREPLVSLRQYVFEYGPREGIERWIRAVR